MRRCGPKQWESCEEEKRGCRGCYYYEEDSEEELKEKFLETFRKETIRLTKVNQLIDLIYELTPSVPTESRQKIVREIIGEIETLESFNRSIKKEVKKDEN